VRVLAERLAERVDVEDAISAMLTSPGRLGLPRAAICAFTVAMSELRSTGFTT
jgi:hypothetical protein